MIIITQTWLNNWLLIIYIFDYFIEQPSPQRIRQIENWDNLDKIPNISKLYNRTSNVEQLKSNISGFFDELFDLLDKNNKDGEIDNQEFQPVLDVLEKCRFIGTNAGYEEPIDIFKKRQESSQVENTLILLMKYLKNLCGIILQKWISKWVVHQEEL